MSPRHHTSLNMDCSSLDDDSSVSAEENAMNDLQSEGSEDLDSEINGQISWYQKQQFWMA